MKWLLLYLILFAAAPALSRPWPREAVFLLNEVMNSSVRTITAEILHQELKTTSLTILKRVQREDWRLQIGGGYGENW